MPVQKISVQAVITASDRLARCVRESGFEPDTVIAVARGGFMPARFVCDFLGISRLLSLKVQHYGAGAQAQRRAEVTEPLGSDISGARVLLVDDVNDSGETLEAARPYLEGLDPAAVRMGVLHEKANTHCRADFVAETIDEWRWILYPWAVVEDVGEFLCQMQPPPTTRQEALNRLEAHHGLQLDDAELDRVLYYHGIDLAAGRYG
ncbi:MULTISPECIES: phosphoribosyltransferase [unclassified Guyparkeria]|uniref:phosphoribosyltransferase n=1 Tax=unclassified Guyparkeria TaxID=2626246 RepID=UPI0012E35A95|nr:MULTISPECIES: phosphoribosyltransferase [unclassified Guyparkeria]